MDFKPIVVFRYHDHMQVVRQRVAWIKRLNPGIPVYGMYGGCGDVDAQTAACFAIDHRVALDAERAWMNLDLAVLDWYRHVGSSLSFSHAYVVEWDLVFTQSLHAALPTPRVGQSLLTGYIPLALVEGGWGWTNGSQPQQLEMWLELKRIVADTTGFAGPYHACLGPGPVLSRQFFEAYDRLDLPALCHDELRLPLVHGIAGLEVASTNLYPPKWWASNRPDWVARFNCASLEVDPEALYAGVGGGHTAFHPVKQLFDEERVLQGAPPPSPRDEPVYHWAEPNARPPLPRALHQPR